MTHKTTLRERERETEFACALVFTQQFLVTFAFTLTITIPRPSFRHRHRYKNSNRNTYTCGQPFKCIPTHANIDVYIHRFTQDEIHKHTCITAYMHHNIPSLTY